MCTSRGAAGDAETASAVTRRPEKALKNILRLKEGDSACGKTGRVLDFIPQKVSGKKGGLENLSDPTTVPQLASSEKGELRCPCMVLEQSDEGV